MAPPAGGGKARDETGVDRLAQLKLSDPQRRIAAFPAFRLSAPASAVTLGRLVDDADDAERHAHPLDAQAVRARPLGDHGQPTGSGTAISRRPRHGVDPSFIEHEPVDEGAGETAPPGRLEVAGIGGKHGLDARLELCAAYVSAWSRALPGAGREDRGRHGIGAEAAHQGPEMGAVLGRWRS